MNYMQLSHDGQQISVYFDVDAAYKVVNLHAKHDGQPLQLSASDMFNVINRVSQELAFGLVEATILRKSGGVALA